MKSSIFRLALILGMTTAFISAQSVVEGTVASHAGKVVAGATVQLHPLQGPAQKRVTDAQGEFRFLAVPAGEYDLEADAQGYLGLHQRIVVKPRQPLQISVELPTQEQAQQQVTVRADALLDPNQTGTARMLTRADLEQLPFGIKRDIPSLALNIFPGASQSHDNYIHVRGNEVSLHEILDGVSFLDNPQQQFNPGTSPLLFESANLVTGQFPAEIGDRFGGVLDVTTRSGFDMKGHGSLLLRGGTFNNNDAAAEYGGTHGKFGYYFFGDSFTSDWYFNPPEPKQFHDFGFGLRGGVQIDYRGEKNSFKFLVMGGGVNAFIPNSEADQEEGRNSTRRLRQQTALVNWQHIFSPKALISTSVYQRTTSERIAPTTDPVTEFMNADRKLLTDGVRSDFTYTAGKHVLKTGIDLKRLDLHESLNYDGRFTPPLGPDQLDPFSFAQKQAGGSVGLYAQDHYSPFRDLAIDYGVRWDRFDLIDARAQVSPRFGIAYHVRPAKAVIHFSYDRFFSPYPLEYALLASHIGTTSPDPDQRVGEIRPYRQHYFEVGWSQELAPKVGVEFNLFQHFGQDPFEFREVGESRLFLPINASRSNARGAEFAITLKQLERIGISGRFSYALQETRFTGPITGGFSNGEIKDPGEKFYPAFDERHLGTASLYFRRPWRNFWSGVDMRLGSGTAAHDGAQRLPAHYTADLNGGFTVWNSPQEKQRVDLELNLQNVGDNRFQIAKESEETPIQFASPRVFSGGFRFKF